MHAILWNKTRETQVPPGKKTRKTNNIKQNKKETDLKLIEYF